MFARWPGGRRRAVAIGDPAGPHLACLPPGPQLPRLPFPDFRPPAGLSADWAHHVLRTLLLRAADLPEASEGAF